MPKLLKKLLTGFGILVLVFLLTAVIITGFFEKEIGKKVITEVNSQLSTGLKVKDFKLSILRSFPDVAADLIDVKVLDTRKGGLLEADKVSFRLGLLSLFKTQKQIKKVVIENGALFIHFDKKGKGNYDILKPSKKKEDENELNIDLREAVLKKVELLYTNEQTRQEASVLVENAIFSGQFSAKEFELENAAKLKSEFVDLSGTRYLVGKDVAYLARLYINLEKGFYDFEKLDISIEKNVFEVDGFIDTQKEGTDYDLTIECKEGNIESVIQLLPEKYLSALSDFSGKGQFLFNASVKGRLNEREKPAIKAQIKMKDGRIVSPRLNNDLKDVSFSAVFSNGSSKNNADAVFNMADFKGYFNRELLEMKLKIENLDDPKIDFHFDGALPLAAIYGLFDNPSIKSGGGEIEFKNLSVNGRYEDMRSIYNIRKVKARGEVTLDDAELKVHDEKLIFDRGKLILDDNLLTINGLKLEGAGTEIYLDGKFENLLPVLFADSLNTKKAELKFESSLKSPKMDLDRLVALTEVDEEKKKEVTTEKYDSLQIAQSQNRERFTNLLNGTFEANVDAFNYNKIEGQDFKGKFVFENNRLIIKGEAKGMEGYFELDGKLVFETQPWLSAKIECNEIDVKEFFEQAENFGQEVVKAENVDGALTARMLIDVYWDETGKFQSDKLKVSAALSLEEGELVDVRMFRSFSSFIHMEDLRHIKFTDTENWLEVRNRVVYIPAMFIRSNAVNLTISGQHSFDQKIDYNIKVNAGQVLINYLKPHNPNLNPQKAERNGWFNLYYNINGTVDDYKVTNSRRKVVQAFEESERRKKIVQANLESAFGNIKLIEEPQEWRDTGAPPIAKPKPTTGQTKPEEDEDEYIEGF